ncbi:unnamed protein product [Spirodela intermedia]|uniref:Uncharacterized protein n=1 Tax=Spirodela intermedia TaxID=51605 RepID=A0A7I8LHV0_SPIIN|nr:unnamed protein product [Spirodela intermedia]
MELEAEGGGAARIFIGPGSRKTEIGRGRGFDTPDRTVSRRHVSFQLIAPVEDDGEARVSFEVLGRNPIIIVTPGGNKIVRRSEEGELSAGDRVSLSLRHPIFFSLKCRDGGEGRVEGGMTETAPERERTEEDEGIEDAGLEDSWRFPSSDLSQIDPVREFGFMVREHEFDDYLKRIREPEKWNWFLADERENSDKEEEEAVENTKKGERKAQRGGEDDEEWRGDSEDEKMAAAKAGGAERPGYLTRSEKKRSKPSPGDLKAGMEVDGARKRRSEEEEDEEDETLGGFIVGDNGEEEGEQEEEEEEEFDDKDDDD